MLTDQSAVVTGAGSGIGRAVAITLAEAGARVALAGRTREKLEATRTKLGSGSGSALVAAFDGTDRSQVEAMVASVLDAFGSIDILVCCAGMNVTNRSLRSLTPEDWDRVVATNLTGTFNVVHYVLPFMRERGSGLVIQISSISGIRPSSISGTAYSASKSGQAVLGICIGREERGRGIRSTVIYGGEVRTSFLDSRAGRPGGASHHREGILEAEDVASAVRFIAELPPRAHIPQLVIKPTIDDFS